MIGHDLRVAARGLMRAPAVSISAILCLALGLGVTAAISSAVDRALVKPLPFRNPERLVTVYRTSPQFNAFPFSAPNYTDLARASRQLEAFASITPTSALVSLPDQAVQASRLRVTGNFFPMLGAPALRGRLLGPADDAPDQNPVVVLSEEFWRTKYGADPQLISRTIQLDGRATTVVGILPRGFRMTVGWGVLAADVWTPMRFSESEMGARRSNFILGLGRLAPGATPEGAERELVGLFDGIVGTYPELKGESVRVVPMQEDGTRSIRTPLLLLFGAVCMILLIAATNVASLLLARGVQRQREMAIRTAIGASRWAVMRPVIAESILLAVLGVILGLGLAWIGVRAIGALAALRMPQLQGLAIDLRIAAFALVLSAVVAVVCGAVPAWRGTSVDPQDALRGGRGGGAGRGQHRLLGGLVVMEVALSLVLLIGGGLVLKGFLRLLDNDPGFDTRAILTMDIRVSPENYPDNSSVPRFLEPALEAVRGVPGVASAAAISLMPYRVWGNNSNVRYEGKSNDNPTTLPIVENRIVTPGFFDVTKQRLIGGRLLRESDDGTVPVMVVNEALVKRDFPGQDAVGKRVHRSDTSFATIVGVVSDIRNVGPTRPPTAEFYRTYRQSGAGTAGFSLMIRVAPGDPMRVAAGVQAAIRSVDRGAAITLVMPMAQVVSDSVGSPRFILSLIAVFAVVAVVLAVAGLYGVMSYVVAQRTREIGIRTALGSTPGTTMQLIARQGMLLVGIGTLLGLAGGAAVSRLMSSMLYGVSALDLAAWSAAVAAMVLAGLAATLVPSLRAARVDPLVAIRME